MKRPVWYTENAYTLANKLTPNMAGTINAYFNGGNSEKIQLSANKRKFYQQY